MKTYQHTCITAILFLFILDSALAQHDLTIHHMSSVPQSNYNNPSFIPEAKFYIGIPALSSVYLDLSNNMINPKHLLVKRPDDSVEVNVNNFVDHLHKRNALSLHFKEEILAFGFRVQENYFNLSLTSKVFTEVSYPKDLLGFVLKGNASSAYSGKTADLSGIGADAVAYHDLSIGYSRDFNKVLQVGGRAKLLMGVLNVQSRRSDLTITTADETELHDLSLASSFELNSNLFPFITDENAQLSAADFIGSKNMGFGLDLGVTYRMTEDITVSGSALDLGYITWKSNPVNVKFKNDEANFSFNGFEMTELFGNTTDTTAVDGDESDFFDELGDSVINIFDIDSSTQKYSTFLPAKVLLSATYSLTEKDKLGGLLRMELWKGVPRPALTLSYQRSFGKTLLLSVSYSARNRDFANVGFGFAANLGPIQLYMVSDNVLGPAVLNNYVVNESGTSVMVPASTKNLNFHFGMNLVFGYKKKDQVKFTGKLGNSKQRARKENKEVKVKDTNDKKKGSNNKRTPNYEDETENPKPFKDEDAQMQNEKLKNSTQGGQKKARTTDDDRQD